MYKLLPTTVHKGSCVNQMADFIIAIPEVQRCWKWKE